MPGAYGRPIADTHVTRESLTLCEFSPVPCEALNQWWFGDMQGAASSDGTSAATAAGGLLTFGFCSSDGTSAAQAVPSLTQSTSATSDGTSAAVANATVFAVLNGVSNGTSAAVAAGSAVMMAVCSAAGTSSAIAVGEAGPLVFPVRLRTRLVGG